MKILLSIISTFLIFYFTNINDSVETLYHPEMSFSQYINFLIEHEVGGVCPLGVISGQLMIIIGLIQVIFLYNNNFDCIKSIYSFIFILAFFTTLLLNFPLLLKLLSAFILQAIIIYT